jgi:triacylglycerol lipase
VRIRCLSLALAIVGVTLIASPAAAQTAPATQPILFIHGYQGNEGTWDVMIGRFQAAGYESLSLYNWQYNSNRSNVRTADAVRAKVDEIRAQTGWDRIDIITHSMGGLSSRYYLKNLGGTAAVDEWVSLGGPNHGSTLANACIFTPCREMRPGSSFLTALNADDETPGSDVVRYGTWWSPCDEAVDPDVSVALDGATNTQTPCFLHSYLHDSPSVFQQVLEFVQG